jgi:hypothetical protein
MPNDSAPQATCIDPGPISSVTGRRPSHKKQLRRREFWEMIPAVERSTSLPLATVIQKQVQGMVNPGKVKCTLYFDNRANGLRSNYYEIILAKENWMFD